MGRIEIAARRRFPAGHLNVTVDVVGTWFFCVDSIGKKGLLTVFAVSWIWNLLGFDDGIALVSMKLTFSTHCFHRWWVNAFFSAITPLLDPVTKEKVSLQTSLPSASSCGASSYRLISITLGSSLLASVQPQVTGIGSS